MKNVQIGRIYSILKKEVAGYDVPVTKLISIQANDPFKVLIATILSSRTNDTITAKVAKRLFEQVKSMEDIEGLSVGEIECLIYPAGFYKTKARQIKQLPGIINEKFGGKIPDTVEQLVSLPGVGRKTANLVVSLAFNKPAVCVDTHVHRIMNRIGYVNTKTALQTEMELRRKLPKKYWNTINTILVAFGQNMCRPIRPKCSKCPIFRLCSRRI